MKKGIMGLSIGAAALQALALLVFFVTVLLQRQLKVMMNSWPEVAERFIFPGVQTVYLLLVTAVIAMILISSLAQGRSIWAEVLGIAMLAAVCTLFYRVGVWAEQSLFVARYGEVHLAAYGTLQSLTGIADGISSLASSLALVACGLSIAAKKLSPRA